MSSYLAQEASIESGSPVELYEFAIANGTTYYMCSGSDVGIVFNGQTYLPVAINRAPIPLSAKSRTEIVQVTLPANHALAALYANIVPAFPTKVTIYRYHRTDSISNAIALFTGVIRIVSFSESKGTASIGIMPYTGQFKRNIPRYTYQSLCGNILYDRWCTINPADFTVSGVVSAVTSAVEFTVAGLDAQPDQWSTSGYVSYGGDYRLITNQTGAVITIIAPFTVDVTGVTVSVFAGCDHGISTCNTKFSNGVNFRGFVDVPVRNPFSSGL
jgi:uncharacterized phage protein (TIGR02218 family)